MQACRGRYLGDRRIELHWTGEWTGDGGPWSVVTHSSDNSSFQLAAPNNVLLFYNGIFASLITNKLTFRLSVCLVTNCFVSHFSPHRSVFSVQSVAWGSKLNWIWIKLCHTEYPWSGRFSHQITQIWESKLWEKLWFCYFSFVCNTEDWRLQDDPEMLY